MPTKKEPVVIEHKDKMGRTLAVGDCVAFPHHNTLVIGVIKKLNPKTLGISSSRYITSQKYSDDTVKLEGPDVTLYLLKDKK